MTRIVTDGAADLPESPTFSDITVVRGSVRLGASRWQGDLGQFWAHLGEEPVLPATQAPSVEQLAAAYAGDEAVVAVHVSGELSRTLTHARQAAAGSSRVTVVDSRSMSVGTGLLALAAFQAARAGIDADQLSALVSEWTDRLHVHALIDDAAWLVHGGRAGLVAAKVGRRSHRHVVAVKGHVIPICQVRQRSEALRELVDHVREHLEGGSSRWAVGHGDAADVNEVVGRLSGLFGCEPAYVTLLGAPVGSHMGPRSLVVGYLSDG